MYWPKSDIMSSVSVLLTLLVTLSLTYPASGAFVDNMQKWIGKVKEVFGYESCQKPWLTADFEKLDSFFNNDLHGQHLVRDITMKSLRGHLQNPNPQKALVLSFHGLTGNGKNYVSKAIAESLYKKGLKSQYAHLFAVTSSFPHESKTAMYSDQIRQWVSSNVSACSRNLFIFDEMDRMHPGLMDAIKPYLDHYDQLGRIDYRKSIFLFLGNIAGKQINDFVLEQWQKGRSRDDIKLRDIEPILQRVAYNEGGLWRTRLIDHGLVSAFIPFLPMEIRHVHMCIKDDLRRKGKVITPDLVERIADELEYFPADLKLYSTTGCKRVSQKVDQVIEHDEL